MATNGTSKVATDKTDPVAEEEELSFYEDVENLKKLCDFLRSTQGPPVREAVEMDKRVHYLKGEKLVNFLDEPKKGTKWPENLPKFASRHEAIAVCKDLCRYQFIHRSEKRGKGDLTMSRNRDFDETGYFTWVYEGDKTFSHMMTTVLIAGFLCCTCFPIWPTFLKVFVWYMSVTLLLLLFFLITIRGFLFLCFWIVGFDFWFLPNLFDEQLNFVDSFKPVTHFEKTATGQLPYRLGIGVAFFSFCYWAVTQPSEFDGFKQGQMDFIKDLYAGTLLSDMSHKDKEDIDKPKMRSLEDIMNMEDEDSGDDLDIELTEEEEVAKLLDNLVDEDDSDDDEDLD